MPGVLSNGAGAKADRPLWPGRDGSGVCNSCSANVCSIPTDESSHAGPRPSQSGRKSSICIIHLIENRDRVVSKDELFDVIWRGRTVSESTLTSHVNFARRAIGDTGEEQRLIRTIARKGFRFVGDVEGGASAERGEIKCDRDRTQQFEAVTFRARSRYPTSHRSPSCHS